MQAKLRLFPLIALPMAPLAVFVAESPKTQRTSRHSEPLFTAGFARCGRVMLQWRHWELGLSSDSTRMEDVGSRELGVY